MGPQTPPRRPSPSHQDIDDAPLLGSPAVSSKSIGQGELRCPGRCSDGQGSAPDKREEDLLDSPAIPPWMVRCVQGDTPPMSKLLATPSDVGAAWRASSSLEDDAEVPPWPLPQLPSARYACAGVAPPWTMPAVGSASFSPSSSTFRERAHGVSEHWSFLEQEAEIARFLTGLDGGNHLEACSEMPLVSGRQAASRSRPASVPAQRGRQPSGTVLDSALWRLSQESTRQQEDRWAPAHDFQRPADAAQVGVDTFLRGRRACESADSAAGGGAVCEAPCTPRKPAKSLEEKLESPCIGVSPNIYHEATSSAGAAVESHESNDGARRSCSICGRYFQEGRLQKHEDVCRRSAAVAQAKRQVFDSKRQRSAGILDGWWWGDGDAAAGGCTSRSLSAPSSQVRRRVAQPSASAQPRATATAAPQVTAVPKSKSALTPEKVSCSSALARSLSSGTSVALARSSPVTPERPTTRKAAVGLSSTTPEKRSESTPSQSRRQRRSSKSSPDLKKKDHDVRSLDASKSPAAAAWRKLPQRPRATLSAPRTAAVGPPGSTEQSHNGASKPQLESLDGSQALLAEGAVQTSGSAAMRKSASAGALTAVPPLQLGSIMDCTPPRSRDAKTALPWSPPHRMARLSLVASSSGQELPPSRLEKCSSTSRLDLDLESIIHPRPLQASTLAGEAELSVSCSPLGVMGGFKEQPAADRVRAGDESGKDRGSGNETDVAQVALYTLRQATEAWSSVPDQSHQLQTRCGNVASSLAPGSLQAFSRLTESEESLLGPMLREVRQLGEQVDALVARREAQRSCADGALADSGCLNSLTLSGSVSAPSVRESPLGITAMHAESLGIGGCRTSQNDVINSARADVAANAWYDPSRYGTPTVDDALFDSGSATAVANCRSTSQKEQKDPEWQSVSLQARIRSCTETVQKRRQSSLDTVSR
eukprot:TRINITY_DN17273_c0_g1_i1.p1 TRINITY_DN17273_c0_g1~~TRINITY_DN17273_c0_g1_i1.p1  ORF type:complete len:935 (-),score=121.98 TRINITY_DN17273_c0_g1_i1:579-3383(-)